MSKVHVFVRVPPRIVTRIKAALRAENAERRAQGLEPVLLFGTPPAISLPQWFARAGEREAELVERGAAIAIKTIEEDLGGPTLNVNFDIGPDLAQRCLSALRLLNEALADAGEDRVCLRAEKPSLTRWFLRAGLRELQRQERAEVDDGKPVQRAPDLASPRDMDKRRGNGGGGSDPEHGRRIGKAFQVGDRGGPSTHGGAGPERTGGAECSARARLEVAPGATEVILAELPSRASRVRDILRRGPATVDEIAKAAGVGRNEAHNTIGGLLTEGKIRVDGHRGTSRRGKPKTTVYALAREAT